MQSLQQYESGIDDPEGQSQKLRGIADGTIIRQLQ